MNVWCTLIELYCWECLPSLGSGLLHAAILLRLLMDRDTRRFLVHAIG